jgi:protein involved in polysaccharide export with SLBB domain
VRYYKFSLCLLVLYFLFFPFAVVSQTDTGNDQANNPQEIPVTEVRALAAMASPDYLVTAGDVYTLVYTAGTAVVKYSIIVDSTYRIRISNLGIVDAGGKTYLQLKSQVETIVSNNYPLSGVQFVLTQPAAFRVYVRGEVIAAAEVSSVWALSRLSSVLGAKVLTPGASLRDITIRGANGQEKTYDLFKASRFGDLTQDPYLRPGDTITVSRAERIVVIDGAVERPGTYQLLAGENLNELIEGYGNGFTDLADQTRVEIVRYVNGESVAGNKIFLTNDDLHYNFVLQNYDEVFVPENRQLQPVIFVEGAVGVGTEDGAAPTISTKLTVPFSQGEYYSTLVRRNQEWFSAVSDTRNAYIVRGEVHIPINLNPMLYDTSFHSEVLLQPDDTLVIPFRQYFVTVAGAVVNPGRYPYIPDREWDYYIALAGGFVAERNVRQVITITDISGKIQSKTDTITPEAIITAETNAPLYYFNQIAPIITTVLSIISTTITLLALIAR